MPIEDIAKRDLFAPLGIESFLWDRDKRGRAMSYMGLKLRTRDLAKLAWVMANDGKWINTRVVPSAWVAASSRTEVTGVWPNPPIASVGYGLLWFTGTLEGKICSVGVGIRRADGALCPLAEACNCNGSNEPSNARHALSG